MKKVLVVIATLAMAFSVLVLGSRPASAGWVCDTTGICGTVKHGSDAGYDAPIAIRCNYGSGPTEFVYEGQSSTIRCRDTDEVYVRDNEEVWCKYWIQEGAGTGHYEYIRQFDAKGWHKITDHFNKWCVLHRD